MTTPKTKELLLKRITFTERSTLGELWLDGKMFCCTLEPPCQSGPKIPGHTAIPQGRYLIEIKYSNRMGRKMPFLVDVPGFEGIMIHTGNIPPDTQGCIIVGQMKGTDYVGESRAAFNRLLPILCDRTDNRLLFITISGPQT